MDSRDDYWKIDVIPDSGAPVRLHLVANRPCTLPGALCAYDGRRLSTPHKHIVPGTDPNTAPAFPNPLFAGGASGLSVPENSSGSTVVGRVQATDAENDPLSYTLAVSGVTTEPPLEIHAETGEIRVAFGARLDHEQRETYRVTVTASDDLDASNTATFDITIGDVNEAPVFPSNTAFFSVPEAAEAGAFVGPAVTATDVDENDTLTYTLSGADASDFDIDPDSGQITVRDGVTFDMAMKPTYAVTVEAFDQDGATATVEVTITVGGAAYIPPSGGGGFGGGFGGGGGGGGGGPTPSELDFEWTVQHDIDDLDGGHGSPSGMWSDGTTLWILENGSGTDDAVYAYDIASGERVEDREFELDNTNRAPRGIWSDGSTVWVSDSGRNSLFAHDLESGARLPERDIALAARNRAARGIWSADGTMWVLDGRKDSLFAYDLASGALLAEYALEDANGDAHGLWSDETSVWVSDHGAKRLFAYRLPAAPDAPAAEDAERQDLERVRDEEFPNTVLSRASNNSPRGIWSDGDVMYVVDASDGKVYTYNMPDAIDARLSSLTLSGVEVGEFDPGRTEYEGVIAEGATETVVTVDTVQRGTDVDIDPPDADEEADGHQVAFQDLSEITVTVTSADGSREKVYRVSFPEVAWDPARDPWPHCLRGAVSEGFSLAVYEGGSLEELVSCAESRDIVAFYALHEGVYLPYILGAPDFVSHEFRELFPDGLPVMAPLVARSSGPPSADAFGEDLDEAGQQPWSECLHGTVVEGFSLVVYEGGSVEELVACAENLDVTAVYVLADGEWVSYILGAPEFANQSFLELYADGLPSITPLVAKSEGASLLGDTN